jgi:hypothetical protein
MAHARLSPSNHRWVHCPGSPREEALYDRSESSPAALDGTGTHTLLEAAIKSWGWAQSFIGQMVGQGHPEMPNGWRVDADRAKRVDDALSYIYRRIGEIGTENYPTRFETESKSDPGKHFGRTDWHGTCDVTLLGADTLEVIDYKDGSGFVAVENNPQLLAYAIGKFLDLDDVNTIRTIRLTIIQPKTHPVIRTVDLTPEDLMFEGKRLSDAAAATDDPNAPLVAGDWCQWCPHKSFCAAHQGVSMATVSQSSIVDVLQVESVQKMTGDQLAVLLSHASAMRKVLDQAEDEALSRLKAGGEVPGYAVGFGPSKRTWAGTQEEVEAQLKAMQYTKDEIWVRSFVSPAQAEKKEISKAKKAKLAEMIVTLSGEEKPVPSKTKMSAEKMFADVKPQLSFL